MCLAVAAEVSEIIDEFNAEVDVGGVSMKVSTMLLPEVKKGDYVLVHAGFAIERIDRVAAEENLRVWRELNELTAEV